VSVAGDGGFRASSRSGRAGDARSRLNVGSRGTLNGARGITGGDSIAETNANGGDGGEAELEQNPEATSGDSGKSIAQSSSTNTGDTGAASSTATPTRSR